MEPSRPEQEKTDAGSGAGSSFPGRHALREQDALWADFLRLAEVVVNSLSKSVKTICDGRLELVSEVKEDEEESDRREVHIEEECLRILARYEPVASDLRRMATILKVNRDWERIADLSLRLARRARKATRDPSGVEIPEGIKSLARDTLSQVKSVYNSLLSRDASLARAVIRGDTPIDQQYRAIRSELKHKLALNPEQLDSWLRLINLSRSLERIADHAKGIAQTIVYLQEGTIIRHNADSSPAS